MRWRPVVWLALAVFSQAAEAVRLFKSSSLYTCMEGSSFTASKFYVVFTPDNGTVTFDIDGSSQTTSNVVLDIEILAYGYHITPHPIIYPCETTELIGLCPLNAGPLQIKGNAPVPADGLKGVPGLAFHVPDIDVKVRLWVNSTETGKPIACVEADLGNEKTVHQQGVAWTIALIVLLSVFTSAITSGLGHSITSAHLSSNVLSLLGYFQGQALIGMTSVKMPPIVRAWTQNFQWSMGVIRVDFLQILATWYQRATGGRPSTFVSTLGTTSVHVQKRSLLERADTGLNGPQTKRQHFVQGIERVGFVEGIEITNIFFTSYMFFVIFVFITSMGVVLFKHGTELLIRMHKMKPERFHVFRSNWKAYLKGVLFRILLITFPQMVVFCFWETTKRDSPAEVVLGLSSVLIVMFVLAFASFRVFNVARRSIELHRSAAYMLYSNDEFLGKWGILYAPFKARMYFFFIPLLFHTFAKGFIIALGQRSGVVQAVAILVLELVLLIVVCILQPYMDAKTNRFNIAIVAVSFVNAVLLLFFTEVFGVPSLVIGIMGVLFFVLNVVFAILILVTVLWTSISAITSKNPETRFQPMQDDRSTFIKSRNDLNTELDALSATARGDTKGMTASEAPVPMLSRQSSLRDSHSKLLSVRSESQLSGTGFSSSRAPERPPLGAHGDVNWKRGVGY